MTNPTADLTALPPVRVEPDARQRIRKALAEASERADRFEFGPARF